VAIGGGVMGLDGPTDKQSTGRILYQILYQRETPTGTFDHNRQQAATDNPLLYLVLSCVK